MDWVENLSLCRVADRYGKYLRRRKLIKPDRGVNLRFFSELDRSTFEPSNWDRQLVIFQNLANLALEGCGVHTSLVRSEIGVNPPVLS